MNWETKWRTDEWITNRSDLTVTLHKPVELLFKYHRRPSDVVLTETENMSVCSGDAEQNHQPALSGWEN